MKKIPLTQGKFALVDDEDFDELNQYKWYASKNRIHRTYYAVRSDNGKKVHMHRVINATDTSLFTDHIDGNGLNDQKSNLRTCTRSQNNHNSQLSKSNTSGFKGVYWHKRTLKWTSSIRINNKQKALGSYSCLIKAAKAYDSAARDLFGEFANTNFKEIT